MPAPVGNQFWKARSKHGKDKAFSTPKILWEAASEYFEWCDANPLMSYEWNGKEPIKCELEKMRPYTLKGLCIFLDVNEKYFNQFTETTEEYSNVCTRIRDIIHTQKFEGAAAGLLDRMVIIRDLGLIEKREIENNHRGFDIVIDGSTEDTAKDNEPD